MSERISAIPVLRRELVDGMSSAGADLLRSTILDRHEPVLFFSSPMSALRAVRAFSNIVLNEHRGLDNLYILAATAQDPVELANGMGAIGAASYVNGLVRTHDQKPFELGLVSTRYGERVKDLQNSLNGSPDVSISAESLADLIRVDTRRPSIVLAEGVESASPDRNLLLSGLVETSLLIALDTAAGDPTLKAIKVTQSADLLTNSSLVFSAAERLMAENPEYFDLIFGKRASFWREYRDDLFPDLLNVANRIIEERALIKNWQSDPELVKTTEQLYYVASAPILKAERNAEAKRVALEKARAERAANIAHFETQWTDFTNIYEQKYGPIGTESTPQRDVDFMIGGLDILHRAIFEGKTDAEIKAGLETIVPKFWPFKDLGFILEQVLGEPSDGASVAIPGQRVFARLLYLPQNLRPQTLGARFRLNEDQRKAKSKIMAAYSKASHPDMNNPVEDPQAAAIVLDFVKAGNAYYNEV